MNRRLVQFALREWWQDFRNPIALGMLAGTAAVVTLVGPFDSRSRLSLAEGFVYWAVLVFSSYAAGSLLNTLVSHNWPDGARWFKIGLGGLLTGGAVTLLVLAINLVTFAWRPTGPELLGFVGTVFAVSLIVSGMISVARQPPPPVAAQTQQPTQAPIMDRVPLEKRGRLMALSVEDHYVRVKTNNGEALVLMRLSDAIKETGPTPGAQVHRSHWVAFDAVRRVTRAGDRAILHLEDGIEIPVSRANMPKIREAGLLAGAQNG